MIRDIPILTFEAPDDFISRAAWLRESEVLTWCEEHLKPLLEALNSRSRFSFGEDFARTGDLSCFVLLEITESLAKRGVSRGAAQPAVCPAGAGDDVHPDPRSGAGRCGVRRHR